MSNKLKTLFILLFLSVFVSCSNDNEVANPDVIDSNDLYTTLDAVSNEILHHDLGCADQAISNLRNFQSKKPTTVYIGYDPESGINRDDLKKISTIDELMVLSNHYGAELTLDKTCNLNDSVTLSATEASNVLSPLVKSSKDFLKARNFTDSDISEILIECDADETILIPLVLAMESVESNNGSIISTKSIHTKEITWSGVGDCLIQAVGLDIFYGISQSTLKTWTKAAIKKAVKSILPKCLGPIGVALIVGDLLYCIYNL